MAFEDEHGIAGGNRDKAIGSLIHRGNLSDKKKSMAKKMSPKEIYKRERSLERGVKRIRYENSKAGEWNGDNPGPQEERANLAEERIAYTLARRKKLGGRPLSESEKY